MLRKMPFAFLWFFSLVVGANSWSLKISDLNELIVGGESAKIQDVPYQAAFYFYDYYFCGGCIVSKTHILTAAHCVDILRSRLDGLSVRVGTDKMHKGGHVIKISKIAVHPKFSLQTVDYDAAVVELKTPLNLTDVVQPLKIGRREPKEGEEVKVSGWGFVKEIGPPSRKLRSVFVRVVDRKACAKNYENILTITNRMVCASGDHRDACYGDSGGPLVHEGELIGIVSSGEGCARKDFPGIYTNIANPDIQKFIMKEVKF